MAALTATSNQAYAAKKNKTEAPNLERIKLATLDSESPYYFPKLREKYLVNDTMTMKPEDFKYYYLGYMFQEDYDPYRESIYSQKTDSLLQVSRERKMQNDSTLNAMKARKESPYELHIKSEELASASNKERRDIVHYADLALMDNPFDLNTMWLYQLVLKDMKKDMLANIWNYRLANLVSVIMGTGDGLSKETAFWVTSPEHEYAVLEIMGYRPIEYVDDYFNEGYDFLVVEPLDSRRKTSDTPKGFYFNVKKPVEEYARKHPDEL